MEKFTEKQFSVFIKDIEGYLSKYMDISNISKNYKETKYILTSEEISYLHLENGDKYKLVLEDGSGKTLLPMLEDENQFYFSEQICCVKDCGYPLEKLKNIMFHELMHVGARKNFVYDNYDICTRTGIYVIRRNENEICREYEYLNEALTELVAKFIYDDLYHEKYKIVYEQGDKLICSYYEKGYFFLAFLLYNYFKNKKRELYDIYFNNNEELLDKILRTKTIYTLETLNNLLNLFQNRGNDKEVDEYYNDLIKNIYYDDPINNVEIIKQYTL